MLRGRGAVVRVLIASCAGEPGERAEVLVRCKRLLHAGRAWRHHRKSLFLLAFVLLQGHLCPNCSGPCDPASFADLTAQSCRRARPLHMRHRSGLLRCVWVLILCMSDSSRSSFRLCSEHIAPRRLHCPSSAGTAPCSRSHLPRGCCEHAQPRADCTRRTQPGDERAATLACGSSKRRSGPPLHRHRRWTRRSV